jgi:HSP20 family protein
MSPAKKKAKAKNTQSVPCTITESFADEIADMHHRIVDRAHEFFGSHGRLFERALDDWLAAERELKWQPPVALSGDGDCFTIDVEAAGIDPADIDIQVTRDQILITSKGVGEEEEGEDTADVRQSRPRKLFRTIDLPRPIDPDKIKAESRFGLLRITAPLAAEATVKRIAVAA